MTTPLTDDTGKQMVLALNAVTAELQNCLKTVGSTSSTAAIAVVPTGNTVSGGGSSPPPTTPNIKLNLLLRVAKQDANNIAECRITSAAPKDLPASRAGELWFTHQVELTPNTGSGIALIGGGEIAGNAVTFLGSIDTNKAKITIQDEIIKNITPVIDASTKTGQIDPVYLKYDTTSSAWSVVADDSAKDKIIQLVPDIVVGKGTSEANKYAMSFVDEPKFADGAQIKMIDNSTEVLADANTIKQINVVLEKVNVIKLKGGRRRRQTRKGGKRYRRKSRRFR